MYKMVFTIYRRGKEAKGEEKELIEGEEKEEEERGEE